jgi:hypothetical protein
LSKHQLAREYLRIVAPGNRAFHAWSLKNLDWVDPATSASRVRPAIAVAAQKPVDAAVRKVDDDLARVAWPAATAPDVAALVKAGETYLSDDAEGRFTPPPSGFFTDANARYVQQDLDRILTAANKVRADLGLQPGVNPYGGANY